MIIVHRLLDWTIPLAVSLTQTASAFLDGVVDEYTIKYLLRHDLWHGWKPRAWLHPPLKVHSPAPTHFRQNRSHQS